MGALERNAGMKSSFVVWLFVGFSLLSISASANILPVRYTPECWQQVDFIRVNDTYYTQKVDEKYKNMCLVACNNIDAKEYRLKEYIDFRQCECSVAVEKCQPQKANKRAKKSNASDRFTR